MAWIVPAFTAGFFLLGMGMIFLDKQLTRVRLLRDDHEKR
jgi:hypothetical protein